jgi:hypothetical protein
MQDTTPQMPMARVQAKFEQALAFHQQGQLLQAQAVYEELLVIEPRNAKVLHLLGVIAAQTNEFQKAADLIGKAIAIDPFNAEFHYNSGKVLQELKQPDLAIESYCKAIAARPDYAEAYANRGIALQELKQYEEAMASYDMAITCKPDFAEAFYNRGNLLCEIGKFDKAITSYDNAIGVNHYYAKAYTNRGNALQELKQFEAALASYDKAIAIKPGDADAYYNRGNAFHELNEFDRALASYDTAIALMPDYAEAYSNRGNSLQELKKFEDALSCYDNAIALKPDYAEAYYNRGRVLYELNELDKAISSYDKAIGVNPDYTDAYWNKSFALLLAGNYKSAWELYEWRWKCENLSITKRNFSQPLWLGKESIEGKTILLHSEQGLGDTIQFCRYIPLVADLGAQVILEVELALTGLLKNLDGITEVVVKGNVLPAFDCHCPLMSLPLAFKTDLNSIPSPQPYLKCDAGKVAYWQKMLGDKSIPRIGLAWSGSITHQNDINRSIPLSTMIQHLPTGLQYVSLQKEIRDSDNAALQSNSNIRHFGDELNDFTDTAALCELMDIVISVDTSIAHLCGASGKKTWVLLPFSPDWRWMLDRDDSPWYSSMKLFRQQSRGDWDGVIDNVNNKLIAAYRLD